MWRTHQPEIDPQWAWSRYDGPWTRREAAHLFRRAGFAASHEELQSATQHALDEAVASLVHDRGSDTFQSEMEALARTVLATNNPQGLANWWLYRILHTPDPLLEKTTLFWHGHFATSADKVQDTELMYQQNHTLRTYALGEFEPLVQAISRDPAMLIYLDSVTNRKAHPNENYARELMELFCLGEGNYTEEDVQQLARCFTGWEVRRKVFYFNRFQHDTGTKKILGQEGDFGGEQAVQIVLQHPSAAQFISAKLVHYFVMDEPRVDAVLIEPLAQQLRENGFVIGPVIERILNSQLFYSEWSVGRKIRSPIEMAMGML